MSKLYDGRKKTGYSLEEAYFHDENQRLIKAMKKNQQDESEDESSNVIDAEARFGERRKASQEQNSHESPDKKVA